MYFFAIISYLADICKYSINKLFKNIHVFIRRLVHTMQEKGVIILPETGTIEVNAFTSSARIPLADVAIAVTAADGTAIALRLTDRNGLITPISIPAPEISAGLTPDTGMRPYTLINLYARKEGYEQRENENLQVFPNTVTRLDLEMIPLSELPSSWDKASLYSAPPQNL